jgi:hypothetical protein
MDPLNTRGINGLPCRSAFKPLAVLQLKRVSWERYGLKAWIEAAARRLHPNKLAIALANKLARIAWAVLHYGRNFEVSHDYAPQPA